MGNHSLSNKMKACVQIILITLILSAVMCSHNKKRMLSKERKLAGQCHRVNGNSCTNIEDDSSCSLFNYPSGTCESLGYSISCRMYMNMVQFYKPADCQACVEIQRR